MIFYKCDLCGASMRAADVVTVRAVRADISRGFDVCGDCFVKIEEQAKAVEEKGKEPEEDPEVCTMKRLFDGIKCDSCFHRFDCCKEKEKDPEITGIKCVPQKDGGRRCR